MSLYQLFDPIKILTTFPQFHLLLLLVTFHRRVIVKLQIRKILLHEQLSIDITIVVQSLIATQAIGRAGLILLLTHLTAPHLFVLFAVVASADCHGLSLLRPLSCHIVDCCVQTLCRIIDESSYQGAMMSALVRTLFMPIMNSCWLMLEITPAISHRLKDLLLPLDLKIMYDVDIPWGRVYTATVSPEWSGKSFFTRLSNLGILVSESISDWESFLQSLAYQFAIEIMTSLSRLSGVGFLTLTPNGLVKQTEVLFTSSATLTNRYTLWLFSTAMTAQQV